MSRKLLFQSVCLVISAFIAAVPVHAEEAAGDEDAQDTIVVIGSLVPLPLERVGSAVTLIDQDDIEARREPFALDLLRAVPGASVSRTGPTGGLTQLRLRGAEANQTLVLIDGVEASDPISGEFDFSDLLTDEIARIEVIRGEQSALWGSEAIGGVVNIVTRAGEGAPRLGAGFSAGSFETAHFHGSASAGAERYAVRLGGAVFASDGINVSRQGGEADGFETGLIHFKGSLAPSEILTLDVGARYANSVREEDSGFPQPADTDIKGAREQISARAAAQLSLLGGAWRQRFAVSVNNVDARALEDGALTTESHGRRTRLDSQSDFHFRLAFLPGMEHRLTLYAEREELTFENASILSSVPLHKAETVNWGYAAEYWLGVAERLFLTGALRYDVNEDFDNAITFRATASFLAGPATRLHGSVGTGVQNPGFFDLFGFDPGFFLGNPDLKPEQSFGWDAGVTQSFFGGRVTADATWFRSRLDDEIVLVFVPPSPERPEFPFGALTPVNADLEGERQGLEASVAAQLTEQWTLSASYTWTDATENGVEEVRRPRHKAGLSTNVSLFDGRASINLSTDYIGSFRDFDFSVLPTARVRMASYVLVGLTARYRLNDHFEAYVRGSNLLDADYEDVLFFQAPGLAVTAGLTFTAEAGR